MITSVLFARIGLAASVAALMAFGARPALAASPTAACPGEVSVGATGDMVPAPSGMPLNCTAAFSDGTVNFAGRVTGYSYDGYTSTTTIYDQEGQVEGVTNSLGETIILSPERGDLSTITDPLGHTTTFTYNTGGSVIDVAAPMSTTTSYTYDSAERLMTVTDPLGVTTTNAYDSDGLTSSTPSMGNASAGRLSMETVGTDTTTYTYNMSGQLTEMSDSHGNTKVYLRYHGPPHHGDRHAPERRSHHDDHLRLERQHHRSQRKQRSDDEVHMRRR
jgi:YD repeat-containing protein